MKKTTFSALFSLVLLSSLFAIPFALAQDLGCDHAEGYQECVDNAAGCKHRTCDGETWSDYSQFNDNGNGNYECTANEHGGGERCHFVKNTAAVLLASVKKISLYSASDLACFDE